MKSNLAISTLFVLSFANLGCIEVSDSDQWNPTSAAGPTVESASQPVVTQAVAPTVTWHRMTVAECANQPGWNSFVLQNTNKCTRMVKHEFGAPANQARILVVAAHGMQGITANATNDSFVAGAHQGWIPGQATTLPTWSAPYRLLNDPRFAEQFSTDHTHYLQIVNTGLCAGLCGNSGAQNHDIIRGWDNYIRTITNNFANTDLIVWVGASMGTRLGIMVAERLMTQEAGQPEFAGQMVLSLFDGPLMESAGDDNQMNFAGDLSRKIDNPLNSWNRKARLLDIDTAYAHIDKSKIRLLHILGGADVSGLFGVRAAYGQEFSHPAPDQSVAFGPTSSEYCLDQNETHLRERESDLGPGQGGNFYWTNEWVNLGHGALTGDHRYSCHHLDIGLRFIEDSLQQLQGPRLRYDQRSRRAVKGQSTSYYIDGSHGTGPYTLTFRSAETGRVYAQMSVEAGYHTYAPGAAETLDVVLTDHNGRSDHGTLYVVPASTVPGTYDQSYCRNLDGKPSGWGFGDIEANRSTGSDAHRDIAVAMASIGEVHVFERDPTTGQLDLQWAKTGIPGARNAQFADLQGDDQQDLLFASDHGVQWVRNYAWTTDMGQNHLHTRSLPGGASARTLTVKDFDGDRRVDVVVGGTGTSADFYYCSWDSSDFHTCATYAPSGLDGYYGHIRTADMNRDGALDLVFRDRYAHELSIVLGNPRAEGPTDRFANSVAMTLPYTATYLAPDLRIADIDADSQLDIVLATVNQGLYSWTAIDDRALTFEAPTTWSQPTVNTQQVHTIALHDTRQRSSFAGPDLFIGPKNRDLASNRLSIVTSTASHGPSWLDQFATFTAPSAAWYSWEYAEIEVFDIDGDAKFDAVFTARDAKKLCIQQHQ